MVNAALLLANLILCVGCIPHPTITPSSSFRVPQQSDSSRDVLVMAWYTWSTTLAIDYGGPYLFRIRCLESDATGSYRAPMESYWGMSGLFLWAPVTYWQNEPVYIYITVDGRAGMSDSAMHNRVTQDYFPTSRPADTFWLPTESGLQVSELDRLLRDLGKQPLYELIDPPKWELLSRGDARTINAFVERLPRSACDEVTRAIWHRLGVEGDTPIRAETSGWSWVDEFWSAAGRMDAEKLRAIIPPNERPRFFPSSANRDSGK